MHLAFGEEASAAPFGPDPDRGIVGAGLDDLVVALELATLAHGGDHRVLILQRLASSHVPASRRHPPRLWEALEERHREQELDPVLQ